MLIAQCGRVGVITMDILRIGLHNQRMDTGLNEGVPDYRLYRETPREAAQFWIHSEPIPDRTHLHRWEIAAHRHPALFQIFHVTQGSGEIVSGKTVTPFAAPCVLFIPPSAVHGFRFARDVDGDVVTALADRLLAVAGSDRGIAAFAQSIRVVSAGDGDATYGLRRIVSEMQKPAPGRTVALEALVALVVADLARAWQSLPEGRGASPAADPRFEALRTAIDLHFREGRTLEFYADAAGLSPSQLNRIVRRETGMTVQGLLARHLIEAARRDLVFTPTPVAAIAESLGFADPAYFNRFFRKQTGMTPGAYRSQERSRLG